MQLRRVRIVPVCLLLLLLLTILFQYSSNSLRVRLIEDFPEPEPGSRVLIIAPHNDDETLATGALIHRLTANGVKVLVVVITNGDGFSTAVHANYLAVFAYSRDFIRLGQQRQKETTSALQLLGVESDKIIFLGYPDGGLYQLWSPEYWDDPYASKFTRATHSPYSNSYTSRAAYSGLSVSKDLQSIITGFQPTHVIFPHPSDSNSDHLATYNFTKYTLTKLQSSAEQYLYLVHRGAWPMMLNFGSRAFLAPPRSLANRSTWYSLELEAEDFNLKRQAVGKYRTQLRVMEPKLMAFCRRNELLATFPDSELPLRLDTDNRLSYDHYLLQSDPTLDLVTPSLRGAGDLKALYGFREASTGDIHFFLEARRQISSELTYTVDMFLYHQLGNPTRLRIRLAGGETTIYPSTSGLTPGFGLLASAEHSIVRFSLPAALFVDTDRVLLGCSSSELGERVDNMGWRVYSLPPSLDRLANKVTSPER